MPQQMMMFPWMQPQRSSCNSSSSSSTSDVDDGKDDKQLHAGAVNIFNLAAQRVKKTHGPESWKRMVEELMTMDSASLNREARDSGFDHKWLAQKKNQARRSLTRGSKCSSSDTLRRPRSSCTQSCGRSKICRGRHGGHGSHTGDGSHTSSKLTPTTLPQRRSIRHRPVQ